ncbi:MAG: molybdopterin synthase catalytic subunit [SAR86 cluster bacterium]|uniref:Molybdopterin synthase catalytic subunit n=1 Tax=SAR86 cluster bacterium TaxID=2030880 RepID=A0A2A5B3P4_9GAMM|nr:MAG: molybdopterin synthase catalytic subunit [SAR86 cluster bacterium]
MITIQTDDFDLAEEYRNLRSVAGDAGAIVTFTGLVRELYNPADSESDKIQTLFLEHYPGMTEKCLQQICDQANKKWPLLATRIIHRVGELSAKEQIVFVGTASAHRSDAFESAQFMMDYLKSNAPFWKKQSSGGQSSWVDSKQTDKDALKRWQG